MSRDGFDNCFACGRKLGKSSLLVDTRDNQIVYVGSECTKLVKQQVMRVISHLKAGRDCTRVVAEINPALN